jgi:hypothetical protein
MHKTAKAIEQIGNRFHTQEIYYNLSTSSDEYKSDKT